MRQITFNAIAHATWIKNQIAAAFLQIIPTTDGHIATIKYSNIITIKVIIGRFSIFFVKIFFIMSPPPVHRKNKIKNVCFQYNYTIFFIFVKLCELVVFILKNLKSK